MYYRSMSLVMSLAMGEWRCWLGVGAVDLLRINEAILLDRSRHETHAITTEMALVRPDSLDLERCMHCLRHRGVG